MKKLVGNENVKQTLLRLKTAGRVPNALLFAGPDAVGKKQFAFELARLLVCRNAGEHGACSECSPCRRAAEFSIPTFEKGDETDFVFFSQHPDVGLVVPFRRNLRIGAIRALEREANFRPYEADARIFIIDDADKMNDPAANALLKTLEEPPSTSHIILIAARADRLLPTIRSRSQVIRFAPAPFDELERHLINVANFSPEDAALAARVSGGSVGQALGIVPAAFRTQRSDMLAVLEAAIAGDRRELLAISEEMSDARNKDDYEERLEILKNLIRDVWLKANGGSDEQIRNIDIVGEISRLAKGVDPRSLASWIAEIETLQENLLVNLNRRIATDSLFISMAA